MDKVLFSRKSDNWRTPSSLYNSFIEHGYFDPCPFESSFDGLKISWGSKNFVNPPYSKIRQFVDKAIEEHKKGHEIILLIPARTDTKYFQKLVDYGVIICFITGRLKFNDLGSAPFPSCFIYITGFPTFCYWKERKDLK